MMTVLLKSVKSESLAFTATITVFQLPHTYAWMHYVYVNIAIDTNVTFCIIGVLTAQHEMCTNFSRPSTLPKEGERPGGKANSNIDTLTRLLHAQLDFNQLD